MGKYHFAYSGGGTMPESETAQKEVMDSWMASSFDPALIESESSIS